MGLFETLRHTNVTVVFCFYELHHTSDLVC